MLKVFFIIGVLIMMTWQKTDEEQNLEFNFLNEESLNKDIYIKPKPQEKDKPMNVFESVFASSSKQTASANSTQTLEKNNLRNDEDSVIDSMPEFKPHTFDVEKFLEEFDRIDCTRNNGDKNDPLNVLCESQLMNEALAPLGQFNTDHNHLYSYLKDQIYQPLAYDVHKRESLSDLLLDTVNLNEKSSLLQNRPLMANYNKFEETILHFFTDIEGKCSDVEANKAAISENIISMLKRFHLYWNFLRFKGQTEKLKTDTKEIVRVILKSYSTKQDFLNYVSKSVVKGIIKAYYRFVRANKMLAVLKDSGQQLIASQILNRYKAIGQRIKNSNFSQPLLVKELSYLISLLQVYHILGYKNGLHDSTILANFASEIMRRVQVEYEFFEQYLIDEPMDKLRLRQIRDFTATLLLKFRHMTFIMFNYYEISQYANLPRMHYIKAPFAVKIYYELLDNMLLIPKTCANFLLLKTCAVHETTKILRFLAVKYMLKRSTYGWYFLQVVSSMMKAMYSKADKTVWDNWNLFKEYFYQNLFSVMYTYKRTFQVYDMDAIENLESTFGKILDEFKNDNIIAKGPIDFLILDKLDKNLYNEFLNIKTEYNNFSSMERNPTLKGFLRLRLRKFFRLFKNDNLASLTQPFKDTIKKIYAALNTWLIETPLAPLQSFNVGPQSFVPTVENFSTESTTLFKESKPTNDQSQSNNALNSLDITGISKNHPLIASTAWHFGPLEEESELGDSDQGQMEANNSVKVDTGANTNDMDSHGGVSGGDD